MSAAGTTPHSLLQTIEADLTAGENWLAGEAASIGATLWADVKSLFTTLASKQVQIAYDVLGRIEDDAISSMSVEQIATDALNRLVGDELSAITSLGSGFEAIISVYRHSVLSSKKT